MSSSRKRRLSTLGAIGFGGYLLASSLTGSAAGRPVSDDVAAGLRGGLCQWVGYFTCPGAGWGWSCPAGTAVTSGSFYGSATGDIACSSSCGSYFDSIYRCVGSS